LDKRAIGLSALVYSLRPTHYFILKKNSRRNEKNVSFSKESFGYNVEHVKSE
jgi:hypothetical protein